MARRQRIVVGDTLNAVRFVLTTPAGSAYDLTGKTAQAKYKINGGTEKTKSLSVVGASTDGVAEFVPGASDFDVVGVAEGRVHVTSGALVGASGEKFYIDVVAAY